MKKLLIALVLSGVISTIFFSLYQSDDLRGHQLSFVATTSMLADAARAIVSDKIRIHGLMGCGIDPHLYRAKESDVHKLAAADMVI